MLWFIININVLSFYGCTSTEQQFDFGNDNPKHTINELDLSIRSVEIKEQTAIISMDPTPESFERQLWIQSQNNTTTVFSPDTDIMEISLDEGEYRFWVEYTNASSEIYGKNNVIHQYIGENRLIYRSEITLPFAMDVWIEDDIAVIAGGLNEDISMLLVDTSDVFEPKITYQFENIGYIRDVKIFDNILFAAIDPESDGCSLCDGVGIRMYDISQPSSPKFLSEIGEPTTAVHNLYYDKGFLYVASQSESVLAIFDVRDPKNPNRIASWQPNMVSPPFVLDPGISSHDMVVKDNILYVAHGLGFSLVDVSNPYLPKDIENQYIEFGTHNIWPTEDGSYILTTREISSGPLQIWSQNSETFELEYTNAHDIISVHNVHVRGNYAFVSWYTDGVYVFLLDDIQEPTEIGYFDTYDQDIPFFEDMVSGTILPPIMGAWGICPYGNTIVVGDTMRGLLLFDFFPLYIEIE